MIEYHHLIHRIKSETYAKEPVQEKKGGRFYKLSAYTTHLPSITKLLEWMGRHFHAP